MLEWTLSAFQSHPAVDTIAIAGGVDELDRLKASAARFAKVCAVVPGGATRQESVLNGLEALPSACSTILVHDAARPAVSGRLISRVIKAVEEVGAAIPGLPITDTVKRTDNDRVIRETVSRQSLWTVQTPQGARTNLLIGAYSQLGHRVAEMTDEAGILEAIGTPVKIVEGDLANIKITTPADLDRVASILTSGLQTETRTGFGYDVHSFAHGRKLWLGGVEIPHERGLAGHSDADVILHAVCDALLGAAGMGDIGVLFPDTDVLHKDRSSIEFVQEVRSRLKQAGWEISNVDISLLAEAPRVGPYRSEIVCKISEALEIESSRVNIKATTSEKMGFVGRNEGMACWAVATIRERIGR